MHKYLHLFQFLVWSSAVFASPSVKSVAPKAYPQCDEQVAKAVISLQQTVQLQAFTIEHLIKTAQNQTTSTPAQLSCASNEYVSSTIQSAVVAMQQAMEQTLAKKSLDAGLYSTTPTPETNIITTLAPLPKTIQEQKSRNAICGHDSGYTFYSKTGGCYKLNMEYMDWPAANSTCHAERAYLAVINSREEGKILNEMVQVGHRGEEENHIWAFIGFYRDSNDVWKTVTGETVEAAVTTPGFKVWGEGYPNKDHQYRYGVVAFNVIQNVPSDWKYSFICEKSPQSE